MKKVLYFATLLLCAAFTSCEKEEIGGTAVESMAGQWYCTVDAVDENGNPIEEGEDYWGLGDRTLILTYNVAGNSSTQMWINNQGIGNFAKDYNYPGYPDYDMKVKVSCDLGTLTFSSTEAENFADPVIWSHKDEDGNIVIDNQVDPMPVSVEGKILKGAGRQNNGSPADSIIMYVTYKNDPWYPDDGYAKYKISGIRYSGLVEND